jgi:hypothetical protein
MRKTKNTKRGSSAKLRDRIALKIKSIGLNKNPISTATLL